MTASASASPSPDQAIPDQPWPSAPTQRTTRGSASIRAPEPSGRTLRRTSASNAASTRSGSIRLLWVMAGRESACGILATMPELIKEPSRVAAAGQPPQPLDEDGGPADPGP